MGVNMTLRPAILWGASYANTLNVGYILDNCTTYSESRDGSMWVQTESGAEDSWVIGEDFILEGDVRWVPTVSTSTPVLQTGWDGATGWRAFLAYSRAKNPFRWCVNRAVLGTYIDGCFLVDPMSGGTNVEPDGTRSFRLKIRNPSADFSGY